MHTAPSQRSPYASLMAIWSAIIVARAAFAFIYQRHSVQNGQHTRVNWAHCPAWLGKNRILIVERAFFSAAHTLAGLAQFKACRRRERQRKIIARLLNYKTLSGARTGLSSVLFVISYSTASHKNIFWPIYKMEKKWLTLSPGGIWMSARCQRPHTHNGSMDKCH